MLVFKNVIYHFSKLEVGDLEFGLAYWIVVESVSGEIWFDLTSRISEICTVISYHFSFLGIKKRLRFTSYPPFHTRQFHTRFFIPRFFHTQVFHTQLFHTRLFIPKFFIPQLFHTQIFHTHTFIPRFSYPGFFTPGFFHTQIFHILSFIPNSHTPVFSCPELFIPNLTSNFN